MGYSNLGEAFYLWTPVILAGAALQPRRRRDWLRAGGSVACAWGASQAVALVVRRERPDLPGCPIGTDHNSASFPSSHATTSFAAARALSPLIAPELLYGVAASLSLTQLTLGAHFPSDVAAGAVLGTAIGELGSPKRVTAAPTADRHATEE